MAKQITKWIQDLAITTAKLANNAVTNAKVDPAAAIDESKLALTHSTASLDSAISTVSGNLSTHEADHNNPHVVTKSQVLTGNLIVNADVDASAAIVESKLALDFSTSSLNTAIGTKIPLTQKGAANGVATLDLSGKIPAGQLPNSVLEYQGTWAASTNTPHLANTDTGKGGFFYIASDAGTVDFGAGPFTFQAGDWVINNGTIWEQSHNGNNVDSVNGFTGVVVLTTTNISEGTNLYFTDARAKSAAVVNSTAGSQTDQAASVSSMKTYVAAQIAAIPAAAAPAHERIVLSSTDISNGYVDLAVAAFSAASIEVTPKGGPLQDQGVDFTILLTGGVSGHTRITFAGDLLTELVAGDILLIDYHS